MDHYRATTGLPQSRSDGGLFSRFRSCLSRSSSSTNNISSLNSPSELIGATGEADDQNERRLLSAWVDQAACSSVPVNSAFTVGDCEEPGVKISDKLTPDSAAIFTCDVSSSDTLNTGHQGAVSSGNSNVNNLTKADNKVAELVLGQETSTMGADHSDVGFESRDKISNTCGDSIEGASTEVNKKENED